MSKKLRSWMAIRTFPANFVTQVKVVPITSASVNDLAVLMDLSYANTIDHEGETLDQCKEEIKATIDGRYGLFAGTASNLIEIDGVTAAACLITYWKDKPLIAFSMTHPKYQRRGFSKTLIEIAIADLHRRSQPELYLVVTNGNTSAENLYLKIGFKILGEALPGEPPPLV